MPGSFIDTNVLVYLAANDEKKAERAEALLTAGGTISVQVLNELTNVARRKMRLAWSDTHALLGMLRELLVVEPVTVETHELGLQLAQRYELSVYDAMIVSAALQAGCDVLWSEDMQSGLRIDGGVTIRNPFSPRKPRK